MGSASMVARKKVRVFLFDECDVFFSSEIITQNLSLTSQKLSLSFLVFCEWGHFYATNFVNPENWPRTKTFKKALPFFLLR